MHTDKEKRRSILKVIFFYWLAYVLISTIITFWARKESDYNSELPVMVATITCFILVMFAALSAAFRNRIFLRSKFNQLSITARRFIWAVLCWVTLVLTFVMTFSPFGRYTDDADWALTWKIISAPPLLIALGYFSYKKMIKKDSQDPS